jgi:DNA polymerase III subunit gamma/tau
MSYLVLARKYRPQTFDEVYAQDHITKILKNTIELNRTAQAYLFTGTRGVGKTSLARIFSKSLNCLENKDTATPCNKCQNCTEITAGISTDVVEIDGASNTGVDDIRDLQRELMYSASNSRYKIYIIDEVHMLSKNAFNALLKTLEEPPENVIFIFATTEPHKVIPTIISRCQRYDFKRIPINAIVKRLDELCKIEQITISEDALFVIGKKADGSMRDALSLMDQVLAYGKTDIAAEDVLDIFGIVSTDVFFKTLNLIKMKESKKILNLLHEILETGSDLQEFITGLLNFIRNILLFKLGLDVPEIPKSMHSEVKKLSSSFSENDLLYLISILIKAKSDIKTSNDPVLIAEMTFVKLSKLDEMRSIEELLRKLPASQPQVQHNFQRTEKKKPVEKQPEKQIHEKTEHVMTEIKKEVINEKPNISQLTLNLFKKDIETVLKKIQKKKPFTYNYLRKAKLESITNNFIHYSVQTELALKQLNDGKDIIKEIIDEHYNLEVKLSFKLVKPEKPKEDIILNPSLADIKKTSPEIANLIEVTDSILA